MNKEWVITRVFCKLQKPIIDAQVQYQDYMQIDLKHILQKKLYS